MPRASIRLRHIAVILGLSLALGGCVVVPARPGYYGGGWVGYAPPAPRLEYYGVAPYPGYFWIGGYWRWGPGRYLWTPGHWQAPRAGFHWVPRHWVHGARGWRMAGGRWARR